MNHQQDDQAPQQDNGHADDTPIDDILGDPPPAGEYRLTTRPHDDQQT